MTESAHEQALDLEQMLGILRRRWPLIVLFVVVASVLTFVISKQQTKNYTATTSLVFNQNQASQQIAGLPATAPSDQATQLQTNVSLITLGSTAAQTASQIRKSRIGKGLTASEVKGDLQVSAENQSNVVNLSVTATSPHLAARIANTYANLFVTNQLAASQQYFKSALALVNTQLHALSPQQRVGPQGAALRDRKQALAILANLQIGNVQVAQEATVPTSPSSPNVARNVALGALVGLFLGVGVAFVLERFDRRIREPRDLERIYGLPLLGVIPESDAISAHTDSPDGTVSILPPGDAEAFRMLRAHLRYFNVDRNLHVLLVTSAAPNDGKTTIARNLAEAAATMDSRVLLLEADLQKPTLGQRLGISSPGLVGVLVDEIPVAEAVRSFDSGTGYGVPSSGRLDVLVAGAGRPPNPAALIESRAMRDLLFRVRSEYDLVVIDTPPLTAVSDAFPLLRQVDGVVLVGRVGRVRREVPARLRSVLSGMDIPLLGVVANAFRSRSHASYGYGYGYYGSGSEEPQSSNGAVRTNDDVGAATHVGGE